MAARRPYLRSTAAKEEAEAFRPPHRSTSIGSDPFSPSSASVKRSPPNQINPNQKENEFFGINIEEASRFAELVFPKNSSNQTPPNRVVPDKASQNSDKSFESPRTSREESKTAADVSTNTELSEVQSESDRVPVRQAATAVQATQTLPAAVTSPARSPSPQLVAEDKYYYKY